MKLVRDISEVHEAVHRAKKPREAVQTNFFPDQTRLQSWIAHGELRCDSNEGLALFLREDRGFLHFYFYSTDPSALEVSLKELDPAKAPRIVVDLVGLQSEMEPTLRLFCAAGFRLYAQLYRLIKRVSEPAPPLDLYPQTVRHADLADSKAVFEMLSGHFDPYAEQLPTEYEINKAIHDRQVLVAKTDGAVRGLLFYETHGLTSTIRYWMVAAGFREHGLGGLLMRRFIAMHSSVRRFSLWVIATNASAIAKYGHYGFVQDGLVDHVLLT